MTLTLDVLTNVDYSKIEAEVEKIRDRLNKIPDKIKIGIDVGIDKGAMQRIQDLQGNIENAINMSGATASIKRTSKDINTITHSMSTMGSTTSTALRDQIDALTGVSSATKSAKDSADAMKMAWAMQAQEAKKTTLETKAFEKAQKRAESAQRKGLATLNSAEKSLRNWSGAQNSSNEESRAAYSNLQNAIAALKSARQNYDGTESSVANLENATKNVNNALKETEGILTRNGDASKTLSERLSGIAGKFTSRLIATQAVTLAIRSMRQMVTEAIAVDDAMTQMQIVTKASSSEMSEFGDNVAKVAKQTASSITDVIDSATTYARLGYNMDTSTILAKYTSMISKVGDIEVADVQSAVTAIVKAFKIDASDTDAIESVFDKMVEVGNNLPVSVSELAEGLNNASSALAAAGNSYEQSLTLLAASNATVQDISKSSTGLRTITARNTMSKDRWDFISRTAL